MIKNRKAGQDETFFMTKTKKLRLIDVMFYNYTHSSLYFKIRTSTHGKTKVSGNTGGKMKNINFKDISVILIIHLYFQFVMPPL